VRLVSQSLATGRTGRARHTIRRTMWIGVPSAIATGTGLMLLGPSFARQVLDSDLVATAIPLTAGWLVAYSIQSLIVETFRGLQDFRRATVYDTILVDVALATTFGAMWALGTRDIGLLTVLASFGGVTAVMTAVAGLSLRTRVKPMAGEGSLERGEILQ